MYASRWLLAPIYLGLSVGILMLAVKFFAEVVEKIPHLFELSEAAMILLVLSLVDIALVGGLLVMVMFSGYENFVSQIDLRQGTDRLGWLGKMDAASLKNKVAASIVAISSIHLLRVFMDADHVANDKILWYILLHLTFVVSAFVMALIDTMSRKTDHS